MWPPLTARGRFAILYAVFGLCLHSCCPYKAAEMPPAGVYEVLRSEEIFFEISSIVIADDQLTICYTDPDGQAQWLTYSINP